MRVPTLFRPAEDLGLYWRSEDLPAEYLEVGLDTCRTIVRPLLNALLLQHPEDIAEVIAARRLVKGSVLNADQEARIRQRVGRPVSPA